MGRKSASGVGGWVGHSLRAANLLVLMANQRVGLTVVSTVFNVVFTTVDISDWGPTDLAVR